MMNNPQDKQSDNSTSRRTVSRDWEEQHTLKKLEDRIVPKECPISRRHTAKMKVWETVKAANVPDAIAVILYLIENSLAAMTTPDHGDGKPYEDNRSALMMHPIIGKALSIILEFVN